MAGKKAGIEVATSPQICCRTTLRKWSVELQNFHSLATSVGLQHEF